MNIFQKFCAWFVANCLGEKTGRPNYGGRYALAHKYIRIPNVGERNSGD